MKRGLASACVASALATARRLRLQVMRVVHMNPGEAVQAHLDLDASQSLAMHFGTFQLTAEGIDEPVRDLTEALRTRGISLSYFRTLGFGDSFRLEAQA